MRSPGLRLKRSCFWWWRMHVMHVCVLSSHRSAGGSSLWRRYHLRGQTLRRIHSFHLLLNQVHRQTELLFGEFACMLSVRQWPADQNNRKLCEPKYERRIICNINPIARKVHFANTKIILKRLWVIKNEIAFDCLIQTWWSHHMCASTLWGSREFMKISFTSPPPTIISKSESASSKISSYCSLSSAGTTQWSEDAC